MPSRGEGSARGSSRKLFCEFCEVCDHEVGLVGPVAEGALSAVDEAGCHTKRFSANAIERMVGDKQDLMWCQAYDLGGRAVRRHMRLERTSDSDRDHALERKADVWLGRL